MELEFVPLAGMKPVACLFGGEAARKLGCRCLGFSARAGLALDTARRRLTPTRS